jgi:DNA-directed RNA polymerase subunit RPC12/RpoP
MIIICQSCNKKFDINQDLIPEKGRLLECNSCNYKWFFKREITGRIIESPEFTTNENIEIFENNKSQENNPINTNNSITVQEKITPSTIEKVKKVEINKLKVKKKNTLLNLPILFIISFIAFILLVDTFKSPLSKFIPNLEFLLYNLYESIKDIILFLIDLM